MTSPYKMASNSNSYSENSKSTNLSVKHPQSVKHSRKTYSITNTDNKSILELDEYNRLIKRLEDGYSNCADLANSIKERANIELQYANSLKKWTESTAKIIVKGGEYNTSRTSWRDSINEASSIATLHQKISEQLTNVPYKKMQQWQKDHYTKPMLLGNFKEVDRYEKEFKKAQKPWSKLFKAQLLAKKNYHDTCLKRKTAQNALQTIKLQMDNFRNNGAENKVDGLEAKILKQEHNIEEIEKQVISTREKYKSSIDDCSKNIKTYESEMTTVYEKIQREECGRLRFVKEILLDVHLNLDLANTIEYKEIYKQQFTDLASSNPEDDIKWWHNVRGMGIPIQWPVYEEYDPESAIKSVAYHQSQRASKHLAGTSNIETKSMNEISENELNEKWVKNEFNENEQSSSEHNAGGNPFGVSNSSTTSEKNNNNPFGNASSSDKNNPFGNSEHNDELPVAADRKVIVDNAEDEGPPNYTEQQPVQVQALFDYEAQDEDEITLIKGMTLTRLEEADEKGWCKGRLENNQEGLFPAQYVCLI